MSRAVIFLLKFGSKDGEKRGISFSLKSAIFYYLRRAWKVTALKGDERVAGIRFLAVPEKSAGDGDIVAHRCIYRVRAGRHPLMRKYLKRDQPEGEFS